MGKGVKIKVSYCLDIFRWVISVAFLDVFSGRKGGREGKGREGREEEGRKGTGSEEERKEGRYLTDLSFNIKLL